MMSNQARITATGSFVNIAIDKKKSTSPRKSPTKASPSPQKDKFSTFNRESLLGESDRRKSVCRERRAPVRWVGQPERAQMRLVQRAARLDSTGRSSAGPRRVLQAATRSGARGTCSLTEWFVRERLKPLPDPSYDGRRGTGG